MKRFDVLNKVNGATFHPVGESLEAIYGETLPLEWGSPAIEVAESTDLLTGEVTPAHTIPAEYEITVVDIDAELAQQAINENAYAVLKAADWKRSRHLSQKALGITTSLSDEEYLALELEAQIARDSIVK